MNEYVELSQLQKFCREYTATDAVGLILADRTDLLHTSPAIIVPEGATNGDMIKAMFPDIEMWGESKDTLDYSLGGMVHRVTKSWWNAPYKKDKKMKTERAMEILDNVVNFVSIGNDTGDTINELLKYGFEAEELVNDFNFSKIDVEDVTGEKIEEEEERE